jgi:predicted dehydrogenase
MKKIPVALVGLGRIGSLLEDDALREKPCTHAGAAAGNADCRLSAGADIDARRRELFAKRWGCPVYADPAEMLRIHKPAILHIATPPETHAYYCKLAVEQGVPVAVCEKPLASSLREAEAIAALEQSGRIRIITNHERRYAADYREARDLLRAGPFGHLLSVKALLYMGQNRRLAQVFWDDGTHLVDAMMFLTGAVMRHERRWGASLEDRRGTAYLSGYLLPLDHARPDRNAAGGAALPFLIELGAGRDHLVFELEFSFERGRLRIGNGIFEVWESGPAPYAEQFRSLAKTREGFQGPTGYFSNMARDAAACARDKARRPQSRAADGLRVIQYLHAAEHGEGGT